MKSKIISAMTLLVLLLSIFLSFVFADCPNPIVIDNGAQANLNEINQFNINSDFLNDVVCLGGSNYRLHSTNPLVVALRHAIHFMVL